MACKRPGVRVPLAPQGRESKSNRQAIFGSNTGSKTCYAPAVGAPAAKPRRRGRGEGSIYKDEAKGRWYAAVSFGYGPDGKTWRRQKVSGRTRAEVAAKLAGGLLGGRLPSAIDYLISPFPVDFGDVVPILVGITEDPVAIGPRILAGISGGTNEGAIWPLLMPVPVLRVNPRDIAALRHGPRQWAA